jgi:hypothetical protein
MFENRIAWLQYQVNEAISIHEFETGGLASGKEPLVERAKRARRLAEAGNC